MPGAQTLKLSLITGHVLRVRRLTLYDFETNESLVADKLAAEENVEQSQSRSPNGSRKKDPLCSYLNESA